MSNNTKSSNSADKKVAVQPKPVKGSIIEYKQSGIISINEVECDPRKLTWSEEIIGKEKILTIKGVSIDNFPICFEFKSRKGLLGFDYVNRMITKFKDTIETQKGEMELVDSVDQAVQSILRGEVVSIAPPPGIILKKGEGVIFYIRNVDYSQLKTKTEYYHGGVSYKLTKNVRIRGGKTTPVKREYIDKIDTGMLILTNKRLVFSGANKIITIELKKVMDIDTYTDGIVVAKDGVQRKMIFTNFKGWVLSALMGAACDVAQR